MMKKILIISCLIFFFTLHCYAQRQSPFEDMRDSLLISMKQLILEDLSKDSLMFSDRSWWSRGLGESFVFEVVFYDEKTSYILMMRNSSQSMQNEFKRQMKIVKIQKKAMMNTVRKYVNEHNELPYELIGYLNYRFLILYKEEEEFKGRESFDELLTGEALYGEYKFRPDKDGLVIISKYTEILQGENAIRQKYNSGF